MLKKFQDYLLLQYPLLWNTRLPFVLITTLFFHILFFTVGYADGAIDFIAGDTGYVYDIVPGIVVFFNILLSALIFIVWLVFYFRNNAFKSFYPLKNYSLYKEWILILIVCILNCTYSASYTYGKDARARSYFSKEEAFRRMHVIGMASYFADGPYVEPNYKTIDNNGVVKHIQVDSFTFKNKKYGIWSLMNKSVGNFYYRHNNDSVDNARIKNWLYNNQKDSVLNAFNQFYKIAGEHNAKGNISSLQWLSLVYKYPDFADYKTIGTEEKYPNYNQRHTNYTNNTSNEAIAAEYNVPEIPEDKIYTDTLNRTIKNINGVEYIFPKYYVPVRPLSDSYGKIIKAYTRPELDFANLFIYIYMALAISILIFSFRVTSGKSWLISVVTLGITGILSGVFSIIISSEIFYYILWVIIILTLLTYYIIIYKKKKSKGYSVIIVNILLWLLPLLLLLLFGIAHEYSHLNVYYPDGKRMTPETTFERYTDILSDYIIFINAAFILLYMYFLTIQIKKWKGIAEG